MAGSRLLSLLVVHPEAEARRALIDTVRRALPATPIHAAEAGSATQALQVASWLDPKVVLLDLSAERMLAFDAARALRRPGRLVLGLFNPMLAADRGAELFRAGTRAGFTDFVALPASESEIAAALAALDSAAAEPRRDGRVVAFVGAQGGVGTTTLATGAALLLAGSKAGGSVVLCDAAVQFGNAAAHLGLAPDRDLIDLIRDLDGAATLSPYLLNQPETGLNVLASPRDPVEAERVTPEELSRALIALRRRFDTVVVDLPPAIDLLTIAALDLADRISVVTTASTPAVVSTERLLRLLDDLGLSDRVRLVINQYGASDGLLSDTLISQRLARPIDRTVPFERAVLAATSRGTPLVLGQRRGAFVEAMGELAGEAIETPRAAAAAANRR